MWALYLIGVVIIVLIIENKIKSKTTNNTQIKSECISQLIKIDTLETNYLGGFSDVSIQYKTCRLSFLDDKTILTFINPQQYQEVRTIPNEDIISVQFATKEYISQQVGLGKLVVFGWLALGMKNNKKTIEEYIMMNTKYGNESISIIFNGSPYDCSNETLLKRIQKQIKRCQ